MEALEKCLTYLDQLGYRRFNFSPSDLPRFGFQRLYLDKDSVWLTKEELIDSIKRFASLEISSESFWGYIYTKP